MLRRRDVLAQAMAAARRRAAAYLLVQASSSGGAVAARRGMPPPPGAAAAAAAGTDPAAARRFASSSSSSSASPSSSAWSLGAAAAAAGLAATTLGMTAASPANAAAPAAAAAAAPAAAAAAPAAPAAAAPSADSDPAPKKPAAATSLFTRAEVRKHRAMADRVWVTHGTGVYDVTDFIAGHPGGAGRLMLAAGGPLEPFWKTYPQHAKPYVLELLERHRIGQLDPLDPEAAAAASSQLSPDDPYAREPERHPALVPLSLKPYNAETPAALLTGGHLTPNDLFYVRHHFPVPVVDPKEYVLTVQVWDSSKEEGGQQGAEGGGGGAPRVALRLTLDELKARFPRHEVTAVMQCTGNRRTEMRDEAAAADAAATHAAAGAASPAASGAAGAAPRRVVGLDWTVGGIGNASWAGARLSDVLRAAGVRPGDPAAAHVHFLGLDGDEAGEQRYEASVPARLCGLGGGGGGGGASDGGGGGGDALLAYEMNGAELPRDHGYPVRVIVPGVTGARSVKWVGAVLAAPFECQGQWQQRDYKAFSPGIHALPAGAPASPSAPDWSSAPPVHEMPVSSAICEPAPGTRVPLSDGTVTVKGWAWSGGGQAVIRVDVSPDGGRSWLAARLLPAPGAPDGEAARAAARARGLEPPFVYPTGQEPGRAWGWTLWEADVPLPEEMPLGGEGGHEAGGGGEGAAAGSGGGGAARPNKPPPQQQELELCVKATDSSYNTQPESSLSIWNPRGVVNNAWHRVRVLLVADEEEGEEGGKNEGVEAAGGATVAATVAAGAAAAAAA